MPDPFTSGPNRPNIEVVVNPSKGDLRGIIGGVRHRLRRLPSRYAKTEEQIIRFSIHPDTREVHVWPGDQSTHLATSKALDRSLPTLGSDTGYITLDKDNNIVAKNSFDEKIDIDDLVTSKVGELFDFPGAEAPRRETGDIRIHQNFVERGSIPSSQFDFDLTFSKGVIHKELGLQPPKLRFDKSPTEEGTIQADVLKGIPVESNSQEYGLFDPPFIARTGPPPKDDIMAERFTIFKNVGEAKKMWEAGISESARILKPDGKLMVKIQDTSFKGKRLEATQFMKDTAEANNLELIDIDSRPSRGKGKYPVNFMIFKKK
jgi:hypothetical protein